METLNNQVKNKVLSENIYFDTETGNRILDYKSDYLMSDTDAERDLLEWIRKNIVNKRPELTTETIEKMIANYKYKEQLINLTLQF